MDARTARFSLLPLVLTLIGFTAVIAQIVLMRELFVVFRGNEISFGVTLTCWLLWTAVGSGILGRLKGPARYPHRNVAFFQLVIAIVFPATVLAVRATGIFFGATPGEILGPGPMILTAFVSLSFFCLISGALFTAGSRLYAQARARTTSAATSSMYLLEAVGSGIGGVLASLVLIRHLDSTEIALVVSVLNLFAAALLTIGFPTSGKGVAAVSAVGVCLIAASVLVGRSLETASLRYLWRGYDVVETRNSVYGDIAVVATGDTESIYENGVVVSTIPDPEAAEEAVHFAMLQHPAPRRVLLIGGGIGGAVAEVLKHPTVKHVDYVELDPEIIRLGSNRHYDTWLPVVSDPRVHVHQMDGRLFLQRAPSYYYSVIIVNLPDPQTAQLNRFYTSGFFFTAMYRLLPDGIFSFRVSGAENYISDELAEFLRCEYNSLMNVFAGVKVIPGSTIHFIAATEPAMLVADGATLVERLRSRRIETKYVSEHFIPYRLMPDRVDTLLAQIKATKKSWSNSDFKPIAYYFSAIMWSTRFHESYRRLLQRAGSLRFVHVFLALTLLLTIAVVASFWRFRDERRLRAAILGCVSAMGMTMIGLQVLLLLAFQALFGFVYHQLAILIAAFMMGMALGSRMALRRRVIETESLSARARIRSLMQLQISAAASPLLIVLLVAVVSLFEHPVASVVMANVAFPALAIMSGALGGYQFPIASRAYFGGPVLSGGEGVGTVYALDLLGACGGAGLISAYFVPVFGFFGTAVVMAVVSLAPAIVLASSFREVRG